eukprot:CAMPEP_0197546504 /NCGR_PEP_ID=MMETSP1320-20131121/1074_1 /TAXON_ID=91990 /ORGANISM="Bolidomonas sp., Strain RCC2347" /LENGTH=173 /DNA_ID=CAMNT_0043106069 /DNA_START=153 /DNA_END=671 /DNA_ORIENTATION=-
MSLNTDIVLPEALWSDHIVPFVYDTRALSALLCACRTTRDAKKNSWLNMNDLEREGGGVEVLLAMGGKEDVLRRRYWDGDEDDGEWKMRDELSDDVSQWLGVKVEGGRVTRLEWNWGECTSSLPSRKREQDPHRFLTGAIPAEMWMLDGLTELSLAENEICGHLPSEIGRLTS